MGMWFAIFIFLISFSQWDLAHNYRLNCDPCVSNALCQAVTNYVGQFDHTKISLKTLAEKIQTRFISLQKVSLQKSWDGKIDVQISSVQPVYIIDLKNSDRVYVLAKTKQATRIVPALWINPTCLENLPAVCLNLKTGTTKNSSSGAQNSKFSYGVISQQDLNLINQVPSEFRDFFLALDPEISANFLIEWIDRNQIILRYCKLSESYNCKLIVRVNNLLINKHFDHKGLTPAFLARCLNLLPAKLFANDKLSEITTENVLGGHKIIGTSGLDSGLTQFSNFKTKKNSLKNFTIDLRFNKQIVILND